MTNITDSKIVQFSCFRSGIGVSLDRAAWHKRTLRNPENAQVCNDCRPIVKNEVWR